MEDSRGVIDQGKPYGQQRIEYSCDESVDEKLPNHLLSFSLYSFSFAKIGKKFVSRDLLAFLSCKTLFFR